MTKTIEDVVPTHPLWLRIIRKLLWTPACFKPPMLAWVLIETEAGDTWFGCWTGANWRGVSIETMFVRFSNYFALFSDKVKDENIPLILSPVVRWKHLYKAL